MNTTLKMLLAALLLVASNSVYLHAQEGNPETTPVGKNETNFYDAVFHGAITANDGARITVGGGQHGGPNRGLYMNTSEDTKWVIYRGPSGNGKAINGTRAVAGYNFSHNALRLRVFGSKFEGLIVENSNNKLLMSIRGNDGYTYIAGDLEVEDDLVTTSLSVSSPEDWPDYVFADDYALPTLESVSSHINTHQHLPGVPSAAEVEANGLDVGEMNAVLLKKIEELTLYLIEQKQELAQQKQEITQLKQQINVRDN